MYDWMDSIFEGSGTWAADVVSSVFSSETAYDALAGAVIGGATAALTGHDIVDGALIGGGTGAVYGTYSDYQTNQAAGTLPSDLASDPTVDGLLSEDFGLSAKDMSIDPAEGNSFSLPETNGVETASIMEPSSSYVLNGINDQNVAAAQGKYNFNYGSSMANNIKPNDPNWSSIGDKMKKEIISGAIKGGAGYLIARSSDKSRAKSDKELQKMRDQAAEDSYNRTKAKVGNTSGLIPTFSLNSGQYANNRLNPAR